MPRQAKNVSSQRNELHHDEAWCWLRNPRIIYIGPCARIGKEGLKVANWELYSVSYNLLNLDYTGLNIKQNGGIRVRI